MTAIPPYVKRFCCSGIDMLGNFENGCVVGLTDSGASLWTSYENSEIDASYIAEQDSGLFSALAGYGFLERGRNEDRSNSAYIHVTQWCNLSCPGCYSRQTASYNTPSLDDVFIMLDYLSAHETKTLHISGGEPFLREDLGKIVRHAKEIGIKWVDIITNGTIDNQQVFSEIQPYVDAVNVSIGSSNNNEDNSIKGKGLYGRVMATIGHMLDVGLAVCLLPTIHSLNVDSMPQFLELACRLGTRINFSILSCSACNGDLGKYAFNDRSLNKLAANLAEVIGSVKRRPLLIAKSACHAGTRLISIDAGGNVYPCHMLHSPLLKMDNVFETWQSGETSRSETLAQLLGFDVDKNERCHSCSVRYFCGGGCRARAFACSGIIDGMDPYCSFLRAYFDSAVNALVS